MIYDDMEITRREFLRRGGRLVLLGLLACLVRRAVWKKEKFEYCLKDEVSSPNRCIQCSRRPSCRVKP